MYDVKSQGVYSVVTCHRRKKVHIEMETAIVDALLGVHNEISTAIRILSGLKTPKIKVHCALAISTQPVITGHFSYCRCIEIAYCDISNSGIYGLGSELKLMLSI